MRRVFGQAIEGAAEDERRHCELRLRRHGDRPRHHVIRHAILRHHVPGMHQHRSTDVGTVVQESNDAGIVEVLRADMVADLYANVPGLHASAHLGAGGIDVLQRHLTKRLEAAIGATAHFQRSIVEDARNFQRLLRRPVVRKQHRRCGDHLQVYALPVKVLQSAALDPSTLA